MDQRVREMYEIAKQYIPIGSGDINLLEDLFQEHLHNPILTIKEVSVIKEVPKEVVKEVEVIKEVFNEVVGARFDFDNYNSILSGVASKSFESHKKLSIKSGISVPVIWNHVNQMQGDIKFSTIDTWLDACGYELIIRKKKRQALK